jgi:hypothetical protein
MAELDNPGVDSVTEFNTYEEYLDSHITAEDLYYLEDKELARQLVELGIFPPHLTLRLQGEQ